MKLRLIFLCVLSLALGAGASRYIINQTLDSPVAPTAAGTPSDQPPTVQQINGKTIVVISPEAQRASHIEVTPIAAVTNQPSISANATIIDLRPLFDLRNRLASARADVDSFTAQAANSRAHYQGSRTLFADDRNISLKSLQAARSAMQSDNAKLQSARVALDDMDGAIRQQFGTALADAAAAPTSALFQRLRAGQSVVVRVTLPTGFGSTPPEDVAIDTVDGRTITAKRLSASPLADPTAPGNPWFYIADAALPANLHTSARVPTSSKPILELLIPEQAVVWYGGQTWAYVRTDQNHFTRHYVPPGNAGDHGLMVRSGFHAGDQIVTQGAQLLLSEELKPQSISTTCQDPPECDG
ncbi:MAG: metal transporter [Castellaniella sp.]|uniref:efflux RND transporter periplasmic adaptor subunit n=1 Tax=Castellaniella sp. TaxID=1955812 RepID=UPI00120B1BB2|nr:metal transporter [Castellaniella sp.]TAN27177.1 MAG: metal transporter [Castellaniella sp.]